MISYIKSTCHINPAGAIPPHTERESITFGKLRIARSPKRIAQSPLSSGQPPSLGLPLQLLELFNLILYYTRPKFNLKSKAKVSSQFGTLICYRPAFKLTICIFGKIVASFYQISILLSIAISRRGRLNAVQLNLIRRSLKISSARRSRAHTKPKQAFGLECRRTSRIGSRAIIDFLSKLSKLFRTYEKYSYLYQIR